MPQVFHIHALEVQWSGTFHSVDSRQQLQHITKKTNIFCLYNECLRRRKLIVKMFDLRSATISAVSVCCAWQITSFSR